MERNLTKIKDAVGKYETSLMILKQKQAEVQDARMQLADAEARYEKALEDCKACIQEVKNRCSEEFNSIPFEKRVRHSCLPLWPTAKNELMNKLNSL